MFYLSAAITWDLCMVFPC